VPVITSGVLPAISFSPQFLLVGLLVGTMSLVSMIKKMRLKK